MNKRGTKPVGHGGLVRNQAGTVMPVVIIFMSVLLLGLAILWDWGRVQVHWRGLQTATDAAALSAALSGQRWDQLAVTRYTWQTRFDPCGCDATGTCTNVCPVVYQVYNNLPALRGQDSALFQSDGWGTGGWKTQANCASFDSCSYQITDRWVQYDSGTTRQAAQAAFDANRLQMGEGTQGFAWQMDGVTVQDQFGPATGTPPEPGWCSRVVGEDTVHVDTHGSTTFNLLPAFGGIGGQRYNAQSTARGAWPGVTTPVLPPDRPDVWQPTWDQVCR